MAAAPENGGAVSAIPRPPPTSGVSHLPVEILEYIFALVSPYKDLDNCAATCRLWRETVRRIKEKKDWSFPASIAKERLEWFVLSKEKSTLVRNPSDSPTTISPRYGHASYLVGDDLFVYGGLSSVSTGFNDLWRLNLTDRRWHRVATTGCHPLPKGGATLVRHGRSLILFGGSLYGMARDAPFDTSAGSAMDPELHELDMSTFTWRQISSELASPPRSSFWDRVASGYASFARGGVDSSEGLGGSGVPPLTSFHSATVHGSEMVVFGGQSCPTPVHGPRALHDDIWCLDLRTRKWRKPAFEHGCGPQRRRPRAQRTWPEPRCMQSQIKLDETHLLIIGGFGGPNAPFRDMWLLDMGTGEANGKWKWHRVVIDNPSPPGIWSRPFAKVGDHVVVLGPCEDCGRKTSPLFLDRVVTMGGGGRAGARSRSTRPQQPVDPQGFLNGLRPPSPQMVVPGSGSPMLRHSSSGPNASPQDQNVNGRFGQLRRVQIACSSSPQAGSASGSSALVSSTSGGVFSMSPPKRCSPSSLRPSAAKNAQIRLENLKKHEQRMLLLGQSACQRRLPPPDRGVLRRLSSEPSYSTAVLHMLDVSRVVAEKKASWVENSDHCRCSAGPADSPVYSFHCGRVSEFVVFGGLVSRGEGSEPTNDVYFGSLPPTYAP